MELVKTRTLRSARRHPKVKQVDPAWTMTDEPSRTSPSASAARRRINSQDQPVRFSLPHTYGRTPWTLVLDTARPKAPWERYPGQGSYTLPDRSLAVLKHPTRRLS